MKTERKIFGAVERMLPDPLLLVALDGTLLDANPAASRLCGISELENFGSITTCFQDDPQKVAALLQQFSRSSEMTPGRLRLKCAAHEGTIRIEGGLVRGISADQAPSVLLRLIPDVPGGTNFQVLTDKVEHLNREIHARIRTEEALVAAQVKLEEYARGLEAKVDERTARLRESNKLLEEFTSTMAHDLRSPLRTISGFSSILQEQGETFSAETRSMLDRIHHSTTRMDRMIEGLLIYGRMSQAELPINPMNVTHQVAEILDVLRETVVSAEARLRMEGDCSRLLANKVILDHIVSNLVGNALKFIRPGEQPDVLVSLADEGKWGVISVRDNGIGIEPSLVEKFMRPFERGDGPSTVQGSGLGLAIVCKGVERLGGRLRISSEKGGGSCFSVLLLRAPGTSANRAEKVPPSD